MMMVQRRQLLGLVAALPKLAARAQALFKAWADLRGRVRGIGTALERKLSAQRLSVQGLPYE